MGENLPIRQFSVNELCENPSILIISKRRGIGKLKLIKDIINLNSNVPTTVISPDEEHSPFYCEIHSVKEIHNSFDPKIIRNILFEQKFALKKQREENLKVSFINLNESDNKSYPVSEFSSDDILIPKNVQSNNISVRLEQHLGNMNTLVSKGMLEGNLELTDLHEIKNIIDKLINLKLDEQINKEVTKVYEYIGTIMNNGEIRNEDLNFAQSMIEGIKNLKNQNHPINKNNSHCSENTVTNTKTTSENVLEKEFEIDYNDYITKKTNSIKQTVVLDDCLAFKGTWAKEPLLVDLLYNARHRHISYILSMQYTLGLTPEIRNNFDYVFLFAEDNISYLKRIYEHYAGFFPDFNSFRLVFEQLTKNFGCMVIKNRIVNSHIFDKISYYKIN